MEFSKQLIAETEKSVEDAKLLVGCEWCRLWL